MAGVSRLQYTTDIRLVRVMCSGRVDLKFILRSFLNGMDGVFIGGCRLGECNYITHGNYDALNMALLCKKIMEHIGINPKRLRIEFMSSSDGILLSRILNDFAEEVMRLGSLVKSEGKDADELRSRLIEIKKLIPYIKIMKNEKLGKRISKIEEREGLFTREEIDELFGKVISYYIDPEKCRACMICARRCPVDAIEGGKNLIHVIDQDKCIKCGTCFEACPHRFSAINKITGGPVPPTVLENERKIRPDKGERI